MKALRGRTAKREPRNACRAAAALAGGKAQPLFSLTNSTSSFCQNEAEGP
jgi:hypothetical protein